MIREESEQDLQSETEDQSADSTSLASPAAGHQKQGLHLAAGAAVCALTEEATNKAASSNNHQTDESNSQGGQIVKASSFRRPSSNLRHRNSSPPLRARPKIRQYNDFNEQQQQKKRFSKTLPRGFSLANSEAANSEFSDVYGLYGDLLNVTVDYSFVDGGSSSSNASHGGPHIHRNHSVHHAGGRGSVVGHRGSHGQGGG